MKIIDGREVSSAIRAEIKEKVSELFEKYGKKPKLSVILAGRDPASEIYVANKEKACEQVGILSDTVRLPESVTQSELEKVIVEKAADDSVDGILVQLPLPKGLDASSALALIPANKDVDGFSTANTGKLVLSEKDVVFPCTPHGIIKLLDYYKVETEGKHAVVVGRSNIVGKPVALMLLQRDCTVTICHSKTVNLAEIVRTADILVVAVGKRGLIDGSMIKDGAVVIDAGINRENGKIFGDVDFPSASEKASYITPVPGGVGPMTITML
ncbi:MAG TPA: bifunctional 5,10-methylene-tetrahydrofolate dehydrogenase/5,10-methylene-tetrahydrofolate cyclohydrolase [Clostridiales bacterium]|nr:bifunctional 5,10-methylene-tetrahydrofolate dehydrogenase/5,10-methylene-tetrahydrofolate cyclohydrolase [Clostridiales bacterium]